MLTDCDENTLQKLIKEIKEKAPPLSNIKEIIYEEWEGNLPDDLQIVESENEESKKVLIPPDIAPCDECLRELFTLTDRRYRYPFINCTNCGPRFSIIKDIPYDREKTTMSIFIMCDECRKEYEDPLNRRFHAEPNACPKCGPQITLYDPKGNLIEKGDKAIKLTQKFIKEGKIGIIKGISGMHIVCDARKKEAVRRIRAIKLRKTKPFAVMCKDLEEVKKIAKISKEEENILLSPQRPIVLLKKSPDYDLAEEVAPKNRYVGVILPYSPLHYLLMEDLECIVDTSANITDEPIIYKNEEAFSKFKNKVDFFLLHNREIFMRSDDSVLQVVSGEPRFIRRARGYCPLPFEFDEKFPQILAVGAELKNTFCLSKENLIFMSQHIGDLADFETLSFFEDVLNHFKKIFDIEPRICVCDMHPDYLSTRWAQQNFKKVLKVQHHYAHILSCILENNLKGKVIGVAFDGTGYGADGAVWGGEFLICDAKNFERVFHFEYVPMPGGEKAVKEPRRMALSYLYLSGCKDYIHKIWDKKEAEVLIKMIDKKINCPLTSSCGRLFDAVSSILRICDFNSYEGEAAINLEMIAEGNHQVYSFEIGDKKISFKKMIREIVRDLKRGAPASEISMKFHNTICEVVKKVCLILRERYGINKVCLSGGVFQNRILFEKLLEDLRELKFDVYSNFKVPVNDAGISLGQILTSLGYD